MGRCETCRHWEDNRNLPYDPYGTCHRIPDWDNRIGEPVDLGPAKVWSYDGASICTKPEFGCTLHQPKEEAAL